jgi:hypothetical protein
MILSRNSSPHNLVPISKTNTTWSKFRSSDSSLIKSDDFSVVPEIKKLVHELSKIANVKNVKAIATRYPDIHWIDFEFELHSTEDELSDKDWNKVHNLVIDCEWKLRDNSGEKWYFRPQIIDNLSPLKYGAEVIADSNKCVEIGIKTWSSPPHKLVMR